MLLETLSHLGFLGRMVLLTPFLLFPFAIFVLFFSKGKWVRFFLAASFLPIGLGIAAGMVGYSNIQDVASQLGAIPPDMIDISLKEARLPIVIGSIITFSLLLLGLFAEISSKTKSVLAKTSAQPRTRKFPLLSVAALTVALLLCSFALTREPIQSEPFSGQKRVVQTQGDHDLEAGKRFAPPAEPKNPESAQEDAFPLGNQDDWDDEAPDPSDSDEGFLDPNQEDENSIARLGQAGVEPPVFLYKEPPIYPEEAAELRIQGHVILDVVLQEDGSVGDVKVLRGLGGGRYGFEEAAIDAVRQWQFTPGTVNNEPADVRMTLNVAFVLH